MKIKALVTKNEPREFVHIDVHENLNFATVGTSSIPRAMPDTATMEGLIDYYESQNIEVDLSKFELVEFHLVEINTIGADIRNKLSPSLNLVSMLEVFFEPRIAHVNEKRAKLAELIQEEMKKSKENIEYIANLL